MNLASLFLAPAVATPDRIALTDAECAVSYRDLARRAGGVAEQLRDAGVGSGDRVALIGSNSIGFAASYLGVLWIGAIAVPLNPMATPTELADQLATVKPKALVILPGYTDAAPVGVPVVEIDT